MFKKFVQTSLVLLALLAVTLAAVSDHAYAGKKKPRLIAPDAVYKGKTYGEWAAAWWQAVFATPVENGEHPILNGGAFHGQEKMLYLAAVVGEPAKINVTIPRGTPLFVPVINSECSVLEPDPYHGDDEESLRACANGHIDATSGLIARIDGKLVESLDDYRVESPLFEFGPLPKDNLFAFFGLEDTEGTSWDSVDAGVYLLFAPMPLGKHKLRIRGTFDDSGASIDTTFRITVVEGKCQRGPTGVPPCARAE